MQKWEEGSILYTMSSNMPTKDIFLAVCNEIGRCYQNSDMKYLKSKRELKWKGNNLWCKFGFWSSHYNKAGEWVNLEIVPSAFIIDTNGTERKGVLNFGKKPKNFNVYQIDSVKFEEIIDFINSTLKFIKTLDTKQGLEKFLQSIPKEQFEREPNNLIYLSRF